MFSREEAEIIYNVIDKDTLRDNFSFVAFFIAVYENFAHLIKEQIKGFYTTGFEKSEDGTIHEILLPAYKEKIKNRIVDNKGNKDELKARARYPYRDFCRDLKIICEMAGVSYKSPHKARYGRLGGHFSAPQCQRGIAHLRPSGHSRHTYCAECQPL